MAYTTIKKPSDYFNTKLYTGNGSTQSITGVNFQPDLVWIKNRGSAYSHQLYDVLRGATKRIFSDLTTAEETDANALTSFDSDGFSLGTNVGVNENGVNQVAWSWLANGAGSSNTDGSITSTVSANTTSGFSIVSFTGTLANATVGHGLGKEVDFILIKNRNDSVLWSGYHRSLGGTKYIVINSTNAEATSSTQWNNTDPTSSVFSVGTSNNTNDSGDSMIAYCFSSIKGFSKFGSYTGNGNSDGTFVYTGFKPAFVMIKNYSAISNWIMFDNKRDIDNVVNNRIFPNADAAQNTNTDILDFLSNGFKIRATSGESNESGATYIYMAFAEEPLVGDNPATAR